MPFNWHHAASNTFDDVKWINTLVAFTAHIIHKHPTLKLISASSFVPQTYSHYFSSGFMVCKQLPLSYYSSRAVMGFFDSVQFGSGSFKLIFPPSFFFPSPFSFRFPCLQAPVLFGFVLDHWKSNSPFSFLFLFHLYSFNFCVCLFCFLFLWPSYSSDCKIFVFMFNPAFSFCSGHHECHTGFLQSSCGFWSVCLPEHCPSLHFWFFAVFFIYQCSPYPACDICWCLNHELTIYTQFVKPN